MEGKEMGEMRKESSPGNPPEKVLLLYKAVIAMIGEGCDINHMKVSDITARAGIGKGTAYEYFSSKEEIITNAIVYDVTEKWEYIASLVGGELSFREKVMGVFDYIEERFDENQTICTLVRMGIGAYEVPEAFRKEYKKMQEELGCGKFRLRMDTLMDALAQQGIRDGVINQTDICLQRMAFCAQVMGFASYLAAKSFGGKLTIDVAQAKQFAYDGLVKCLS